MSKTAHWENVYTNKNFEEVSWYQENPKFFIELIQSLNIAKSASIIDIGCGESRLLANLHQLGFHQLTGLEISSKAIEKNKINFQHLQPAIKWIIADVCQFKATETYDLWHDRAVFHFLTDKNDIQTYVDLVSNSLVSGALFILSTFSKNGPLKCSGLEITQYNHEDVEALFAANFEIIEQSYHDHATPFNTIQNFQTSILKRK